MSFNVIRSRAVPLLIDHIDTDQIIPARFLKTVNRAGLGDHLFADWRKQKGFALEHPGAAGASILLAGGNFGCGSSREHAPWALLGAGFKAVIARSFADIFRANALRNGLIPVAPPANGYDRIVEAVTSSPEAEIEVDLEANEVRVGGEAFPFEVDPFGRDCLLRSVDPVEYVLEMLPEIERFEATHG